MVLKGEVPFNYSYKYAVTIHEPVDFSPKGHEMTAWYL